MDEQNDKPNDKPNDVTNRRWKLVHIDLGYLGSYAIVPEGEFLGMICTAANRQVCERIVELHNAALAE